MTEPKTYRKKPVEIEAMEITEETAADVVAWVRENGGQAVIGSDGVYIETLEGSMRGGWGWLALRGIQGEFYPCKPDIFEATYDPVSS